MSAQDTQRNGATKLHELNEQNWISVGHRTQSASEYVVHSPKYLYERKSQSYLNQSRNTKPYSSCLFHVSLCMSNLIYDLALLQLHVIALLNINE